MNVLASDDWDWGYRFRSADHKTRLVVECAALQGAATELDLALFADAKRVFIGKLTRRLIVVVGYFERLPGYRRSLIFDLATAQWRDPLMPSDLKWLTLPDPSTTIICSNGACVATSLSGRSLVMYSHPGGAWNCHASTLAIRYERQAARIRRFFPFANGEMGEHLLWISSAVRNHLVCGILPELTRTGEMVVLLRSLRFSKPPLRWGYLDFQTCRVRLEAIPQPGLRHG